MAKIYEFHDSILHAIERHEERLLVKLRATRTEFDEPNLSGMSKLYCQEIKLILDDATIEVDSSTLPNWLLDGAFKAEESTADAEDRVGDEIPVSLRQASGVELRLEGMNEDTHEYITIKIKAASLSIESIGEPEFLLEFKATNGVEVENRPGNER